MKPFNTVLSESATELMVQKSRFITYLVPVRTEEAATAQLERIRKHHWDAAHHVPAWVLHEGGRNSVMTASREGLRGFLHWRL